MKLNLFCCFYAAPKETSIDTIKNEAKNTSELQQSKKSQPLVNRRKNNNQPRKMTYIEFLQSEVPQSENLQFKMDM